ncbi:MAG: glycosyltransferase [Chitinophagales bacterium]
MSFLAKNKQINKIVYSPNELPTVAIVIAAYNEEKVIEDKLISSLKTNYPSNKFQIFIGSDCSSDNTNAVINKIANTTDKITFFNFKERSGKQEVLNKMFSKGISTEKFDVCIMTDANIIFKEDTIYELVKHFKNETLGIVCANIKNKNIKDKGISKQEQFYISNENQLKINEGKVFQSSIAAFGACYAIRRKLIPKIPQNILMEDFYISMSVLKNKKGIITEPNAICFEDLPQNVSEEFKRKKRISTGNFQNLFIYYKLLWKSNFGIGFTFFSHKIIRWLGPFFMLGGYISLLYLYPFSPYYFLLHFTHLLICLAFIDYILMAVNINVNLLRLVRYFLSMNLALFLGFIKFAQGVKTNIWQPTKRNE